MTLDEEPVASAGIRRMRFGTLGAAAIFAAVAVAVIAGALDFPKPSTFGAPGSGRLPLIYAGCLLVLSAFVAAAAFQSDQVPLEIDGPWRLLAFAGLTAVYITLLPWLGFPALTVPWLLIAVLVAGAGWLGASLTAVILPASIYLIFVVALGVPLP